MTRPTRDGVAESADRTSGGRPGVGRRPLLKALGAGAAVTMGSGVANARGDGDGNGSGDDGDHADGPEGFSTELLVDHATFPDDVGAALGVTYEDGVEDSAFVHDASTLNVVRVSLEPGGTSGWHTDNGPVIGTVVEGAVDVTFGHGDGCVTRTYEAGEATVITGRGVDMVANASDTEPATGYVIFLGVPADEPPSSPAEPPGC